jgi:hypothetical protein
LPVPPLKSFVREEVTGTALEHLSRGLFEAHARDEAGWEHEGGHRQMWDAARDAAFSNPVISPEVFAGIMARRGQEPAPLFPALGPQVERLVRFMVNVLAIEVFARSTFAWAEEVLSGPTRRPTSSTCAPRSPKSLRARSMVPTAASTRAGKS